MHCDWSVGDPSEAAASCDGPVPRASDFRGLGRRWFRGGGFQHQLDVLRNADERGSAVAHATKRLERNGVDGHQMSQIDAHGPRRIRARDEQIGHVGVAEATSHLDDADVSGLENLDTAGHRREPSKSGASSGTDERTPAPVPPSFAAHGVGSRLGSVIEPGR